MWITTVLLNHRYYFIVNTIGILCQTYIYCHWRDWGSISVQRCNLFSTEITIVKLRRSHECLILSFTVGISVVRKIVHISKQTFCNSPVSRNTPFISITTLIHLREISLEMIKMSIFDISLKMTIIIYIIITQSHLPGANEWIFLLQLHTYKESKLGHHCILKTCWHLTALCHQQAQGWLKRCSDNFF